MKTKLNAEHLKQYLAQYPRFVFFFSIIIIRLNSLVKVSIVNELFHGGKGLTRDLQLQGGLT